MSRSQRSRSPRTFSSPSRYNFKESYKPNVKRLTLVALSVILLLAVSPLGFKLLRSAYANNNAQTLPFTQDWSNTGLITTDDDWSGVPGIIGYRGDGLASSTGVDPQTVLGEGTLVVDVNANLTNPNTSTTGGVAEFAITNPVVALQGSGTARAPYIQFHLNTTGFSSINVAYNLRDIDGSTDNSIQAVALQYRVGGSGNFINIPAGFVADASTGPSVATLVTPVSVTLPAAADNQPLVQVRVITTDAVGSDEWIGIDDINITGSNSTGPTGVGSANPSSVIPGNNTLLTVAVTPGTNPPSTAHTVTANLTGIGGSASQTFLDNGLNGDILAGDNTYSYNATVAIGTSGGAKSLPFTIQETAPSPLTRTGSGAISLTVQASTNPTGTGAATPNTVQQGGSSLLTVTVTPGTNPTSTDLAVTGDLSTIGGSANQQFFDDGSNGDLVPGNNVFSFNAAIPANTAVGGKTLPIQITDAQARSGSASISLNVITPPPPEGSLVISQIYGGGGNSGATYTNDFIEIINHSGATISLSGLSVQYASAAGSSWQVTPLTGSLAAGQYYLVQGATSGANGVVLPTPDVTGGINLSATNGKVALVNTTSPLTGTCPADDPSVIDLVGFGSTASCFEGSGPTVSPSATLSVLRDSGGCTDSDDNSDDFSTGEPTPRNTSSSFNNCAVLSGVGTASPPSVLPGDSSLLTVSVTPGSNPSSTGITVVADLSSIGGSASQSFAGNGNNFSFLETVAMGTTPGQKVLPAAITDDQLRTANTTINLTVLQPPPSSDHVVISQVYGGGGNSGATYSSDFVELFNPGGTPFDLTGWSIQYASSTGTGWGSNKQPLGGTIAPGEYYLIKLATGATGAALPAANVEGVISLSGTTGKVALVSSFQALSGPCPLADPNLVDFVGYGSSASTSNFCFEGTLPAPGPASGNNTVSVLRKNGGATDTNNNGNDFLVGAVNPRRTAPIVELGPNVLTTDPTSNGFNIPHDASISVTFTEPVNVDSGWYNIACADLTTHNDATVVVSNSSKTFVITPNVNFAFGQQCTVTINKDNVHDQDSDDSGQNTDTPPSNYVWSFDVVGAGQPAPYPPSVHLTMGNPSNATASILNFNNYLMEKPTYSLSYNRDKGTPNWVSWHLTTEWFGSLARFDTFRPDPAVPPDWYRVQATDYSGSGFDRGHMTPNADRDNENRVPINQETYLMSNMVPQSPDNNQGPWAAFENYIRNNILPLSGGQEVYIVSGPIGQGGVGSASNSTINTLANGHITVPAATWKVVLVLPLGDNDPSRVTAATRTIAILIPNQQNIRNDPWQNYLTTVDNIESLTGYDFFTEVPDNIENAIEAGTDGSNPPGTANQSATTAEDTPGDITLNAVSPLSNPTFTFTIDTPPAHGGLSGSGPLFTYTPAQDYHGPDSFTFHVNDGSHNSNTSTVSITVTEVNDAPTASDDVAGPTDEDTQLNISVGDLTTNDSAGPADESQQTLTVNSVTATANTHGTVSLNNGIVAYSPDNNYNGAASFTYQVCDNGTTSGAPDALCTTATVNITVNPVNDNPVAVDDSTTTDEDTSVTVDVVANDTDTDGDTRTLESVGTAAHGSVTIVSGQAKYEPVADFNGADSFTYVVSDGHAGTATGTVNVTVNPVNDNPVAVDDTATTGEDNPVTLDVVANDTDIDGDSRTLQTVGTAVHGSVTIVSGQAQYSPAADFNGADSFTYVVSDGHGGTATGTVNVTIHEVNDSPTAASDAKSTNEDTTLNFPASDLTVNDSAGPSDELLSQTLTVATVNATANTHGSVSLNSGNIAYAPDSNYNGAASFSYQVCDNGTSNGSLDSKCSTGTVNVTVNPVNDAPVLSDVPATASVVYSTTLSFTAHATDIDVPAQTLAFSLLGQPAGASINANTGEFSWTPTAAQSGSSYTFTVRVTDGQSTVSSSITVTVEQKALTSLGPAQVWLGVKSSDDVGTRFDLLAEVYKNGVAIGSGQLNDVPSGSSGFNNAALRTISLAQGGPTGFRTGDVLSIKLSVRIAASSGHNNGTARLWYNDSAANSLFAATIGGVANNYFLRSGSALATTAGPGPKATVDVSLNRNVGGNPFKPFGTWSVTY